MIGAYICTWKKINYHSFFEIQTECIVVRMKFLFVFKIIFVYMNFYSETYIKVIRATDDPEAALERVKRWIVVGVKVLLVVGVIIGNMSSHLKADSVTEHFIENPAAYTSRIAAYHPILSTLKSRPPENNTFSILDGKKMYTTPIRFRPHGIGEGTVINKSEQLSQHSSSI